MAYFRNNEPPESGASAAERFRPDREEEPENEYLGSDYDDGFDDLLEEDAEEVPAEMTDAARRKRFRRISRGGDVAGVVAGTILILLLLTLLLNMIGFVLNDADRNFTLLQTRF